MTNAVFSERPQNMFFQLWIFFIKKTGLNAIPDSLYVLGEYWGYILTLEKLILSRRSYLNLQLKGSRSPKMTLTFDLQKFDPTAGL
jgi:hypothetical protein